MKLGRINHSGVAFITGVTVCLMFGWSSSAQDLTGTWKLNVEETNKIQPLVQTVGKRGRFRKGGAGAVLLPPQQSMVTPSKTINPPLILDCDKAQIYYRGNRVDLTCNEIDTRTFLIGSHHGRVAKWKRKRLTERYSSTSRTVEHKFTLVKQNRMEVLVRIKPKGARRSKHTLIYDRVLESSDTNSS